MHDSETLGHGFSTITTTGFPPVCFIGDSPIGFTTAAQAWSGLGSFGSAFTPEHWRRCRGSNFRVLTNGGSSRRWTCSLRLRVPKQLQK
ncbi:hypothetical protein PIB30_040168 [Stylosanthes scabra]|uniref:Uncharacterized protein n=1 Tax=Stylosanthes scabra TaxID=79078 RepID=A0ABU6XEV1_9FABA|nr:hypothetical protein [Stylosanthes scabra]